MITRPGAGPTPSLTFLAHAVVVALVVEASVVRLALVLSQVAAGTCNNRTTQSPRGTNRCESVPQKIETLVFCEGKLFDIPSGSFESELSD